MRIIKVSMHCVYTAFDQHVKFLRRPIPAAIFDTYLHCKQFAHESVNEYTFAGVVPWMYARMLQTLNAWLTVKLSMQIQYHYVPWSSMLAEAGEGGNKRLVMNQTAYIGEQVEKITLSPAIYCLLNDQHATFSKEIPTGRGKRIVMAIKLRSYGNDEGKT
jgi:hypothetical protein